MKVNMKLENQLASSCIKKIVPLMALFGIFFCLTSCNMWYQDWKGYLEYWSGTVQIGRVEVSDVTITKNNAGVDTISLRSTPLFTGYIINPQGYDIDESIGELSSNSSIQVTAAVKDSVTVVAEEATILQVRVAATDSALEHTDFTVNFCPVRQDTGTNVGKIMGITLRYNTPPQAPVAVVWDADNNQFTMMQGKKGWEVTSDTKSDKDGWIYWGWPEGKRVGLTNEADSDCVSSFSINGAQHKASSLLTGDKLSGYEIYGYKAGVGTKVEIRALDSEGILGAALYSGSIPYAVTLDGNSGNFNGSSSTEVYFPKGSVIAEAELPEPNRTGWIFVGWLDNDTRKLYDFSKPITGDKKLTAQWSQAIYVNGSAGNDSNYGSATKPVKSMEKALEKIYAANDGSQYTIYVQADYESSHASSSGSSLINITPSKTLNLTIKSVDGKIHTINANGKKGVIQIAPTNGTLRLTVENLIITGGKAVYGGGLYVKGGIVTIQGSTTISNNTATSEGGGICLEKGEITVKSGVTIKGNSAKNGGGVALPLIDASNQQKLTLESGVKLENNSATIAGGAAFIFNGTFVDSGARYSGNTAPQDSDIYHY